MTPSRVAILACLSIAFLLALPIGLVWFGHSLDPLTPLPESALEAPGAEQWVGRDELGRSLSARLLLGGGLSLGAASLALVLALALALIMGGLAGWYHGQWPDRVISWLIALLHTVPFFLLVVT
jgi:peptide/nickel transport system permease protein